MKKRALEQPITKFTLAILVGYLYYVLCVCVEGGWVCRGNFVGYIYKLETPQDCYKLTLVGTVTSKRLTRRESESVSLYVVRTRTTQQRARKVPSGSQHSRPPPQLSQSFWCFVWGSINTLLTRVKERLSPPSTLLPAPLSSIQVVEQIRYAE